MEALNAAKGKDGKLVAGDGRMAWPRGGQKAGTPIAATSVAGEVSVPTVPPSDPRCVVPVQPSQRRYPCGGSTPPDGNWVTPQPLQLAALPPSSTGLRPRVRPRSLPPSPPGRQRRVRQAATSPAPPPAPLPPPPHPLSAIPAGRPRPLPLPRPPPRHTASLRPAAAPCSRPAKRGAWRGASSPSAALPQWRSCPAASGAGTPLVVDASQLWPRLSWAGSPPCLPHLHLDASGFFQTPMGEGWSWERRRGRVEWGHTLLECGSTQRGGRPPPRCGGSMD